MLISSYLYIATVTTAIYTLSLHDALPISKRGASHGGCAWRVVVWRRGLNICHLRQGALVLGRRARILGSSRRWGYLMFSVREICGAEHIVRCCGEQCGYRHCCGPHGGAESLVDRPG